MKYWIGLPKDYFRILKRVEDITGTKFKRIKNYTTPEELIAYINELLVAYDDLEYEFEELQEKYNETYQKWLEHDYSDPDMCEKDY